MRPARNEDPLPDNAPTDTPDMFLIEPMEAYSVPEIDPQTRDPDGHGYVDFLASSKLSVGLAVWPAGVTDIVFWAPPHRTA